MKTLFLAGLLLLLAFLAGSLLAASALALPRPAGASAGWATVARYRTLRDIELPALLAWLQARGPFTQPRPDLLPATLTSSEVAAR